MCVSLLAKINPLCYCFFRLLGTLTSSKLPKIHSQKINPNSYNLSSNTLVLGKHTRTVEPIAQVRNVTVIASHVIQVNFCDPCATFGLHDSPHESSQ